MYTCRWAYCATICGSLSQLDEHVSGHIAAAPLVDLKGLKRRKISGGVWRRDIGADVSQSPAFKRISDELPVHHSQSGDTSIATDTTYPIPSFPQGPSFPSHHHANFSFTTDSQARPGSLDGETVSSQMEDAEIADEMLMGSLRSPSPQATQADLTHPQLSQSQALGIRQRSSSPFVPPTQAQSTQIGVGYRAPSSSLPEASQSQVAFPPVSQTIDHSQPSQSSQLSSDSLEIGRSGPSQSFQPSPPDIITPSMPPPAVPISRRASTSRSLLFGSAVSLIDPAGVSPRIDVVSKEKGSQMGVAGPRRSVGFSFGSQLGSGKTDEGSK